jgi:hypothetical protein
MKVGVKFCGGCNPYIDRKKVMERVKNMLPPGKYKFEYFDWDDCAAFIAVNGCSLACVRYPASQKVIVVSGFEIEGKQYSEDSLASAVVEKLSALTGDKIAP